LFNSVLHRSEAPRPDSARNPAEAERTGPLGPGG